MMFYTLIRFGNLVRSEDDIIDGVASMTTQVTIFGATAWELSLAVCMEGRDSSGMLAAVQIISRVLNGGLVI